MLIKSSIGSGNRTNTLVYFEQFLSMPLGQKGDKTQEDCHHLCSREKLMPRDYTALPRTRVRRSDREVTDEGWIKDLLQRAPIGMLATVSDNQPFLNSNLFVYDEAAHAIYTHTARVGRTRANVEREEQVCFSVHEMGRLLPAETAFSFSVEYASVIVFGTATCISDEQQAIAALHLLVQKYAPHLQLGQDYRGVVPEELSRTSVYRIAIEEWSGKKKEAPADFPGAYTYKPHA
jgi:nitroimidazol reductase NimA-like FMN-containing flavoprotein (pyridoxamine 5'-phosphate oxidase superfamily)